MCASPVSRLAIGPRRSRAETPAETKTPAEEMNESGGGSRRIPHLHHLKKAAAEQGARKKKARFHIDKSAWEAHHPCYHNPNMKVVSLFLSAKDGYEQLVHKGEVIGVAPSIKIFHQAFIGGIYIGFGGLLSMVVAGNIPGADPGTQGFVFAALFPVNLLLVLTSGAQLFTGNCAACPAAVFEGKINWFNAFRSITISWLGNFSAGILFAVLTDYTELCPMDYESGTGCGYLAAKVAVKKTSSSFGQTFVKGIMANWMVCMAVLLFLQAQDMTGKMVAIWFPISAFVAMGMEHVVANMFMLPLGYISCLAKEAQGGAPAMTIEELFVTNVAPVTLGNFVAGAVCVAASYSFAFGHLGVPAVSCGFYDRCLCCIPGFLPQRQLPLHSAADMEAGKPHTDSRAVTVPPIVDPTPDTIDGVV